MVTDREPERDEEKWEPVFRPHPAPNIVIEMTEAEHA